MRVLYYNWVDYLDDENRGGGVTVYQRNLMAAAADREDIDAIQLSSGISYDIKPGKPRWDQVRHGPTEDRDRRFEIINSGTLSPSHYSFGQDKQITHPATVDVFEDILRAKGPFDVVHFNNLEGLPAEVLALRSRFPDTRFVLSLHNYYPFCPQVNLWHQEAAHCADFDQGRKCAGCLMGQPDPRLVRLAHATAFRLKRMGMRPGTRAFDVLFRGTLKLGRNGARLVRNLRNVGQRDRGKSPNLPADSATTHFADRRARMVELINAHVDVVHSVSARTAKIAEMYGIDPAKITVSYIGTPHAVEWTRTSPRVRQDAYVLRLVYMGYMRPDKGFPFLLDALEALPDETLARLDLLVAALGGDDQMHRRLQALGKRMARLTLQAGYKPDQMDTLLADRDLAIVPPVWEDNLPQVALESHCRHVPLLTGDRGGAQELSGAAAFIFKAGDVADFGRRLTDILNGQVDMDAYWAGALAPRSVSAHIDEILTLYR